MESCYLTSRIDYHSDCNQELETKMQVRMGKDGWVGEMFVLGVEINCL